METPAKETARELLDVTTLLMRSLAAQMRQGEQRLEPAHIGILAKVSTGSCSVTDLAQHQAVRLPTMSKSIGLLVQRGWVERWTPPENRRQTMIRLTAEGRRVFAAMRRQAERHVADALAPLTAAERVKVHASLQILSRVLGGEKTL